MHGSPTHGSNKRTEEALAGVFGVHSRGTVAFIAFIAGHQSEAKLVQL